MRVSEEYLRQRKDEIATAAMHLYCKEGPNVSMAAICKAAGIAKGTIFRYYPTRDQMFQEIFDSCRSHAASLAYAGPLATDPIEAEKILKAAIRQAFDWPLHYSTEFQFVTLYTDTNVFYMFKPKVFEPLKMEVIASESRYRSMFESMLRPGLPYDLAQRLLACTMNMCSRYLISNPSEEHETTLMDTMVDSIYDTAFSHAEPKQ